MIIKRGDIFLTDLEPIKGSEQGKIRPCLVVQNDVANQFSPNTIIVPITSHIPDKFYPTVVVVKPNESGLQRESAILCSQIRTISINDRVMKKLSTLSLSKMQKVNEALKASLGIE
jgi:mRNA interferase MazF